MNPEDNQPKLGRPPVRPPTSSIKWGKDLKSKIKASQKDPFHQNLASIIGKKRPRPTGNKKTKKIDADGESDNKSFDDEGFNSFQDDDSMEKEIDSGEEKKNRKALGKVDNADRDSSSESEIEEEESEEKNEMIDDDKSAGNISNMARKIEKMANKKDANGKKKLASPEAAESEEIDIGDISEGMASIFGSDSEDEKPTKRFKK